ncbi:hypothetical protein TUMSATVNIG1_60810 (plasmid) [Vibrio nigripulchritudo]|uniref:hypothetical protein n=1 Tax=Vibrio nigripulchritudo TaxID=28173 RepID=UPI0019095B72|nr:hypothetical protein [Vibrio nigripulchritudo]BCL74097.1 hypothetical protein VNTUMSATTG_60340 [Vibrio nigripulchritudo]BDU35472.1 hypothetical protein TUMSATVNIG1_60810 [Vibrio nigripulchritudo]
MKKVLLLTLSTVIYGCANTPNLPSENYSLVTPTQVAFDSLSGSRHFDPEKHLTTPKRKETLLSESETTAVFISKDWQQIILRTQGIDIERTYLTEENLARTCWALKPDATLKTVGTSLRGVGRPSNINACLSDRLGREFPLFVYSWVVDPILGDYFTLIAPENSYTEHGYLCKLRREGYPFDSFLLCAGN